MIARLKFFGVRAAGLEIALFGGLATAIGLVIGTSFLWATTYPGIPENADLLNAIYRISFGRKQRWRWRSGPSSLFPPFGNLSPPL